ncbi:poly(R)-hydroxyalkanoic acid synthase [Defluviimonas sp. 20V17]|uniref:Class I poly(R)-hydroxyalkanoic acid synthase n=1 Tax=Allgaiera indica TaxID=765699 RepID=A0AAN4ZZF1_9RHOB|nr:class I poly(R)-hydroxyalkanoic acid synthase [Allgaiera indica]KDB03762.1 poly(R)-hydroxyalkanoic acid synthase [Defluviimonas sp. 20V17]GHD99987.1 class I poly(R)-hydroxyalkanoic acid synthase [Allgaiera indica]SDW39297.1 polyhydroxyalkanoate synthase [Allgaiera indica]
MTTDDADAASRLDRLNANLSKVDELSRRLAAVLAQQRQIPSALQGPGQDLFMKAAAAYMAEMIQNPSKIIEQQVSYWGKTLKHYAEAQEQLVKGKLAAPPDPTGPDRRFSNPLWETHPWFNFIKQQYLMNSEAVENAVQALDDLVPRDRKRVEYFARQILDMMAPTNFLGTNPDALERAVETDGESLVQGLENLVRDLEANQGDLLVTLADREAFRVGENLATTPGRVVFRNRMLELIQYAPTTEKVHKTPLIIFPPWINKFYILDLKPKNSLIKWIVDQGYTLFVVSWVNPGTCYADVGMDEYVQEGYLAAFDAVKEATGEKKLNAVGYCIAGTTLALVMALLDKRRKNPVKSATFFTTLTDFSDQGEVGVFLTDDFVDGIEREVKENGILRSFYMSRTFSFLRSNDLIYQPAIRSYMMGEAPPAFDLLYWNGDSTNLPAKMAMEYLRGLCQQDAFARDGFDICGERVRISDVKLPVCAVACETDHIAAWKSIFNGIKQFGSPDKSFILAQSGHIAGIVNPPSKNKYGHYTGGPPAGDPGDWLQAANFHQGSWWPAWQDWLKPRSGALVKARVPGDSGGGILAPAPGTYVTAQPGT